MFFPCTYMYVLSVRKKKKKIEVFVRISGLGLNIWIFAQQAISLNYLTTASFKMVEVQKTARTKVGIR